MKKTISGIVTVATITGAAVFTTSCSRNSQTLDSASIRKDIQELNIYELREKYDNTSNYAHVYWINDKTLRVIVGNTKVALTPEEALQQYGKNLFFQAEYANLLNAASPRDTRCTIEITNADIDIDSIRAKTDSKIKAIMAELDLHESEDVMEQLHACCRLQKYIAVHNKYDDAIMKQKTRYPDEYTIDLDLYTAVVLENGVCTSNSIEMREILSRINVKAECVGLISKDSGAMHMAVLVELMGEYYYFDPTLERAIWEEKTSGDPDNICLCAAGLGKEEYHQYYTPRAIIPRNIQNSVSDLPENIALHRIPPTMVQLNP